MYVTINYNMYTICICNTTRSKLIPLLCTHVYSYMFRKVHPGGAMALAMTGYGNIVYLPLTVARSVMSSRGYHICESL